MEEISIRYLEYRNVISKDVAEYCKKQMLNTDYAIVSFFLSKENAAEIEKIPLRVRNDLRNFCKSFVEQQLANNPSNDLTLEQIAILENLSQRSINVCKDVELSTLSEIIQFNIINSGFLRIRNCGAKSNEELVRICDKYINYFIKSSEKGSYCTFENASPLSSKEENVITLNEYISLDVLKCIEGLSVRSYNVCQQANLLSLQSIIEYYYNHKNAGFLSIRHCGQKSNTELTRICVKYGSNLLSVKKGIHIENQILSPIDNFIINLKIDAPIYNLLKTNISGRKYIPLFKVTNLLIDNNFVFRRENITQVFKRSFNCYYPINVFTLDEVGKQVGLTRERVRQIRQIILRRIRHAFKFLQSEDYDILFPRYIGDLDKPVVLLTYDEINRINKDEGTSFSHLFITFILSIIYNKHFVRVGDITALFGKTNTKKGILPKHLFLVSRIIASTFQFDKFLKYLSGLVYQRRSENHLISYEELINRFKASENLDIEALKCAINTIISNDFLFHIEINSDGLLLLRNSKRTLLSYVQDILQKSHKPLHFTEIYHTLIENGVDVTSEQSIHSLLNRERDIFGLKGAGIFDLRVKGGLFGSIGDVAEQIIKDRKESVPLHELERIICSELVVSKDSISVVLFNYANENRFIKYRNDNVTLAEWQKK